MRLGPARSTWGMDTDKGDDWRLQAVCRDQDPETWFPIGDTGPARRQADAAIAVCHTCPVMELCGQWALDTGITDGIWGGMTEETRRQMVDRRGGRRTAPYASCHRCGKYRQVSFRGLCHSCTNNQVRYGDLSQWPVLVEVSL